MPKHYRPESYRPAPSWLSIWDSIYSALAPHAVSILQPTGFYEIYDIDIPRVDGPRQLAGEEKAAIERIATALTVAAHCSHDTSAGIVRAWLERIAKQPALFRSKGLPPGVHWAIVSNYCRDAEKPGTHLQDLFGRRRVHFEATARRATASNIAKAARRALEDQRRLRGRPRNVANRSLAESLAVSFKAFGGRIVRRQTPIDVQGGGVLYVDSGPFFSFLEKVIGPLQAHLDERGLPGVTLETIERIAAEQFA
ncbi:hypothetical protein IVB18_38160 [Bradyrhizobium sp. 186]|uniref:hypothetical protein n=1 Tax=Bradyrhizobium sp. 186 TaxID=2782654 RepID=UPI002000CBAC|nr:hypothetical protein [Bradyrhizobium sp. 186]UPK33949.1 hypothetical protein IVB18_38160 [Bradyrhizobium sp. 186]